MLHLLNEMQCVQAWSFSDSKQDGAAVTWGKEHRSLVVISGEPDRDMEGMEWVVSGAGPPQVERGGKERRSSRGCSCLLGDWSRGHIEPKWDTGEARGWEPQRPVLTVNSADPRRTRTIVPLDCSACRCLQIDTPIHLPPKVTEDSWQLTNQKGAHRAMLLRGGNPNPASWRHLHNEVTASLMEVLGVSPQSSSKSCVLLFLSQLK